MIPQRQRGQSRIRVDPAAICLSTRGRPAANAAFNTGNQQIKNWAHLDLRLGALRAYERQRGVKALPQHRIIGRRRETLEVGVRRLAPLLMRLADTRFDPQRLRVAAVQMQQLFAVLQREVEAPLPRVLTSFLQQELLAR